jgi:hypothetical protein
LELLTIYKIPPPVLYYRQEQNVCSKIKEDKENENKSGNSIDNGGNRTFGLLVCSNRNGAKLFRLFSMYYDFRDYLALSVMGSV